MNINHPLKKKIQPELMYEINNHTDQTYIIKLE